MLSRVQLFATPWTVVRQAPLSMGILQARILGCVAMPASRGSSQPRDGTQVSCTAGRFFISQATRDAQESHMLQCKSSLGSNRTATNTEGEGSKCWHFA